MPKIDRDKELNRFLADALGPVDRVPDKTFVDRVSQQVRLDELRRRGRTRTAERLGLELLSVLTLGCALLAAGASAPIANSAGSVSAATLVSLVVVFGCWVAIVSRPASRSRA